MIQRISLYIVLGLVLNAVAVLPDSVGFWSILALFWASEHMTRTELIEQLQQELRAARQAAGLDTDNNKDNT
jgi:hypothetical protein